MKATIENTQKGTYCTPHIKHIKLDNEISLQLESSPPIGPGEEFTRAPKFFNNNDPFKLINT